MGVGFLDDEKMRMERWKKTTSWLSAEARGIGMFRRKPYSFALPSLHAGENLFGPVREAALDYFRRERIVWHQGIVWRKWKTSKQCSHNPLKRKA